MTLFLIFFFFCQTKKLGRFKGNDVVFVIQLIFVIKTNTQVLIIICLNQLQIFKTHAMVLLIFFYFFLIIFVWLFISILSRAKIIFCILTRCKCVNVITVGTELNSQTLCKIPQTNSKLKRNRYVFHAHCLQMYRNTEPQTTTTTKQKHTIIKKI